MTVFTAARSIECWTRDSLEQNISSINYQILDQLQDLIGGDQEAFEELIQTFIEEGDEIVADIQSSAAQKDLNSLKLAAHSLKSAAQDYGASELAHLCTMLESRCRSSWPDDAPTQADLIVGSFNLAKTELQSHLQKLQG